MLFVISRGFGWFITNGNSQSKQTAYHSAAFAPTKSVGPAKTELNAWINDQVGITPPVGFFDPLGLSAGKSDATMKYYRESELKHGRVAMAACLGWYLNAGGVHPAFNSELSNDPLKAMVELPAVGWLQFVLGCGVTTRHSILTGFFLVNCKLEAIEWLGEQIKARPGYNPGDLLGAAYWVDNSDEGWVMYQNKELNNGRLAMLAITGMIYQDVFVGDYGDMMYKQLVR
ncbi:hypothetical protein ACHAWX_001527 [Stephanocyclus meneghinianus]